jgi:hypothetical protein
VSQSPATMERTRTYVARAERVVSHHVVEISGPTTNAFRSRIRNVSSTGMLIDHLGQISVGDVVSATLPGAGAIIGTVVRLKDARAGVRFINAISLAAYRAA